MPLRHDAARGVDSRPTTRRPRSCPSPPSRRIIPDLRNRLRGLLADLGDSFRRYGFAVLSDYDLDQSRIDAALDASRRFFALPEAVKTAYVVGKGGQRGYIPSASRQPRAPTITT